jgi:pyruvate dehydrogenase E1 component alpha subunit
LAKSAAQPLLQSPELATPKRFKANKAELLGLYRQMVLIRRFEERAGQLYGLGLIGGFCHLYIGQEAVAAGLQSALTDEDSVITGYRDHGHMLLCGIDPKIVMAELTAFAHKYNEDGGVCVAYFGDGAANQGQVYEAFNMAALWDLPIIFVIENNQYAMGTAVARSSAETHFYRRGDAFTIPGMQVDGMDVLQVRGASEVALAHVRGGKGPVLMEMKTYRYRGHSMSDPAKYRSREEVQDMREKHDPIEGLKKDLAAAGVSEEELKAIDQEIRATVSEAADYAESSPEPEPHELYEDVLVESY